MSADKKTAPFRVVESTARGGRFMVVDDRGDAEMGNWFIASTFYREVAELLAAKLNAEEPKDQLT